MPVGVKIVVVQRAQIRVCMCAESSFYPGEDSDPNAHDSTGTCAAVGTKINAPVGRACVCVYDSCCNGHT